jgi:hypothetical protein
MNYDIASGRLHVKLPYTCMAGDVLELQLCRMPQTGELVQVKFRVSANTFRRYFTSKPHQVHLALL